MRINPDLVAPHYSSLSLVQFLEAYVISHRDSDLVDITSELKVIES
jgi:hypothetical protein